MFWNLKKNSLVEGESRVMATPGWGGKMDGVGKGEMLYNRYEIRVGQEGEVLVFHCSINNSTYLKIAKTSQR
jgi:hypothetical protein